MQSSTISSSSAEVAAPDGGTHDDGYGDDGSAPSSSSSPPTDPAHLAPAPLDESFEVTDQSLADRAVMGDHELPLLVDRGSTVAQFRRTGGPAVSIVVDRTSESESEQSPPRSGQPASGTCSDGIQTGKKQNNSSSDGFDVCREYGYRYEYADEADGDDDAGGNGGGDNDRGNSKDASATAQADESLIIDHDDDPLYDRSAHALGDGILTTDGKFSRARLDWSMAMAKDAAADQGKNAEAAAAQFGGTSYLLGRSYHPVLDFAARRDDESSLLWMTYRRDFPVLNPYGITSDAGWAACSGARR